MIGPRGFRTRLRHQVAEWAALLLKPASWGAVLALVLIVVGLGAAAIIQHGADIRRISHDELALRSARGQSIVLACEETNERHGLVKVGIEHLALRTSPRNPTLRQAKARRVVLEEFVQAIAPAYLAGHGSLKQREAQGCAERLARLSQP
jgi:hypothetical protein